MDSGKSASKIAVHLHLYYEDMWEEISQYLSNLGNVDYDLYVTVVKENSELKEKILSFKPKAVVWAVENRGYDIGPFIDFLHKIDLEDYDYVLKIHTKRSKNDSFCYFNKRRFDMNTWKNMLFGALLVSPKMVSNNLKILAENPSVGMIGNKYILTDEAETYQKFEADINEEMQKIGIKVPEDKHFVAGTMFWVRATLLKPFKFYELADFAVSDGAVHDGALAHLIERMFGWVITSQGYQILGVTDCEYFFARLKASIQRFLYQKKITRKGQKLIKICKIPVYIGGVK